MMFDTFVAVAAAELAPWQFMTAYYLMSAKLLQHRCRLSIVRHDAIHCGSMFDLMIASNVKQTAVLLHLLNVQHVACIVHARRL